MNEEAGLVAAICTDPADDTARLVYADWLQEHEREWQAELIRMQVGGAERATLDHAWNRWKRRPELVHQAKLAFLPTRAFTWHWPPSVALWNAAPMYESSNVAIVERGMVGAIICYTGVFVKNVESLFQRYPITRVFLCDRRPGARPDDEYETLAIWTRASDPEDVTPDRRETIPATIYDCMRDDGTEPVDPADGFLTHATAYRVLSRACAAFGRKRAELPELPLPAASRPPRPGSTGGQNL